MRADGSARFDDEWLQVYHCREDGFIAGIDNGLIRLYRYLRDLSPGQLPRMDDVDVDAVFDSGQLGRTHILNVADEDPKNYFFVTYGMRVGLESGASYEGLRLRDGKTRVMSELALTDYSRAKTDRACNLAFLDGFFSGKVRRYRRFISPLLGDRGQVTHLLVSVTANLEQISAGAFDNMKSRRLVAENPFEPTGRWEVTFNQDPVVT